MLNNIDIFTDVEGVMTADPRIVKDARHLQTVTYNEICNMAYQGAKVVHPRAVEIAMHAKYRFVYVLRTLIVKVRLFQHLTALQKAVM